MKTNKKQIKYSPQFKISVILDMLNNHLGYGEVIRKHWNLDSYMQSNKYISQVQLWERIYLEEGEAGLYIERRGRTRKMDNPRKGRPRKVLDKKVKQDLIAENQQLKERLEQLEMENEYLKKLDALVQKRLQNQKKK